jgi:DNA polymerase III delta prime subunit
MTTIGTLKDNIPWIEKYRPTEFEDIVLDDLNKQLFGEILNKQYFPNLLFYGPPGTGKTTTIMNLIQSYQEKTNQKSKSGVMHLNASDERGIDIIRNQLYQFVKTRNLFETGMKFIILDEVDYMTKNAQQALKYLIQTSTQDVRFCLICNYISKIDESLRNEFIAIRFNQLPYSDINRFLKNIAKNENFELCDRVIETIYNIYHSDIRSMINFIQLHQTMLTIDRTILTEETYKHIYKLLQEKAEYAEFAAYIFSMSIQHNIDKPNILKHFFNYCIRNGVVCSADLFKIEFVVHSLKETPIKDLLFYIFHNVL